MSRERHLIADPLILDLTATTCPPLRSVLEPSVEHIGVIEVDDDITACYTPWFVLWQSVIDLGDSADGDHAVSCHYFMPATDEVDLLIAGLGETPEWFFKILSGADFGDTMTIHVALRWPEIFDYLRASNEKAMDRRFLMVVRTIHGDRWALAEPLRGHMRTEVPNRLREDLMLAAVGSLMQLSAPWESLPDFLSILGGPDLMSRRMKAVAGLLSFLSDAGEALFDRPDLSDFTGLTGSAADVPKHLRNLRGQ